MIARILKCLIGLTVALAHLHARTADIDLFAYSASGAGTANVLFVLDNAANFSASVPTMRCSITVAGVVDTSGAGSAPTLLDKTSGAVEQCALYSALKSLSAGTTASLNVGVMGFNASGLMSFNPATNTFSAIASNNQAGALLMPIVPFTSTNKTSILSWIRQWATSGNSNYNVRGNNIASGAAMQEAWAYFLGKTGMSSVNYSAIAPTTGCGKNSVIFIGNAYRSNATPGDGSNASTSPLAPLSGTALAAQNASPAATTAEKAVISDVIQTMCASGVTTLQSAEGRGVYALNWARYMKDQHKIITYSIGVLGAQCNDEYAAHLQKLGSPEVGGGKFFPTTDFNTLTAAIATALSEILAVNSVFAAVSLPVSMSTQGAYLNQVYVGMFRPADAFLPRWNGNVKQYKLGYTNNSLRLQDADGAAAINSATGFITECARSYWTPGTTDSYWSGLPQGGCLSINGANDSNFPDGNIVEKGAQGYVLRAMTPTSRVVKTCSATMASCTSLTDFSTATGVITQAMLNPAPGAADRDALINWARGLNVDNELGRGATAMRPSAHGDVVHSRPVAVNHGTDVSPQIVVYYGANDGLLHAVNGNRSTSITSGGNTYAAGAELWSFMPPEFYSRVRRLRDNSQAISFPNSAVAGSAARDYGMDGPVTYFQGTVGGATRTYLFATMRRGGRALYAFDVTTPGSPALLWKKGCPNLADDTGCTTGMTGIGQTWSSMKPFFAQSYGGGTAPLLMVSGGYDNCLDYDALSAGGANNNCVVGSRGKAVYILDAQTGGVVVSFATSWPTVADPTIASDRSGYATYAWTADTGGNVYRISIGAGATSTWSITTIASLGCATPASCPAPRRFLFQPSVTTLDNTTYNVMLGSGDREKPVDYYTSAAAVTNYFFQVQDKPSLGTWLSPETAHCAGTAVICMSSLLTITNATPAATALAAKKGWNLALAANEQVVTPAVTLFGVTTFSTHKPSSASGGASCTTNLGTTLVYNISATDASSANGTAHRHENLAGDGLPPSPVVGRVKLDTGQTVPFCIGCSKDSPLEGSLPKEVTTATYPKGRLYWYIQR